MADREARASEANGRIAERRRLALQLRYTSVMRRPVAFVLVVACVTATAPAMADPPPPEIQAHEAYDRGTRAYQRGDYATAAREYAAANALAPNPIALQAALDAAVQADDPVLGTQLLDMARRQPPEAALASTEAKAERAFAHRTGHIRFECTPPCLGAVDGAAVDVRAPVLVRVGSHRVTVESAGSSSERSVTVPADETVVVSAPPAPAPAPAPALAAAPAPAPAAAPAPASARGGLSPAWFFVSLGATAVAGGIALWSGLDTASRHADFEAAHCGAAPSDPIHCGQLASAGQSAQTRTNVLLGVTAALGVTTIAAAMLVQWHASDRVTASVGPGRAALAVRF